MRRNIFITLIGWMAIVTLAAAQPPDTLWTKIFGGSSGDKGYSVQQTDDGGFIITGYTLSYGAGSYDVFLIKTDELGNQVWARTFGGSEWDISWSVQQTDDGGYIIAGYTHSYGAGSSDVYLIKTDESGNQVWARTFGGSNYDIGYSVQQTSDGGYIIAGDTYSYGSGGSDVYLIKTDASGNEDWHQTFGGSQDDGSSNVKQTADGGYIIAGWTSSYGAGYSDVYLIKTEESGNETWSQIFGGNSLDVGYSVQQTSDGGYIIAGETSHYAAGYNDVCLIKTDESGNPAWAQTFGGIGDDEGWSVQPTTDGGYIIAGKSNSYGNRYYDVYLIKTDGMGNRVWTQTVGGRSSDCGYSVQQTSDGGYIVAGYTYSYAGGADVYLIRLEPDLTPVVPSHYGSKNTPDAFCLYPAFPNPFNPMTTIHFDLPISEEIGLAIYDARGRLVLTLVDGYRRAGTHDITFEASHLPSGVYFARLSAGHAQQTQKLLLVK